MEEESAKLSDLTIQAIELVQTKGLEFAISLVSALLIFFVGKWIVNIITNTIR